jgi:hypothetical protein
MAEKAEEMARNKERMRTFLDHRAQQHQDYMDRRDEMVGMVNGLKEAQNIVRQLKSSGSYLEVKEAVLVQLKHLHDKIDKHGKSAFRSMVKTLVQLCSD